jgi:hypothetical protein
MRPSRHHTAFAHSQIVLLFTVACTYRPLPTSFFWHHPSLFIHRRPEVLARDDPCTAHPHLHGRVCFGVVGARRRLRNRHTAQEAHDYLPRSSISSVAHPSLRRPLVAETTFDWCGGRERGDEGRYDMRNMREGGEGGWRGGGYAPAAFMRCTHSGV